MILAASVNGKKWSPAVILENLLQEAGIPTYTPPSDEWEPTEEAMLHKVCFNTIHVSKGRERPCVLVVGFDSSYFTCYATNDDTTQCPNTMYVATTRAMEEMTLLASYNCEPFSFLCRPEVEQLCDLECTLPDCMGLNFSGYANTSLGRRHPQAATELMKFLPERLVADLTDGVCTKTCSEQVHNCKAPISHRSTIEGSTEEVSDINGHIATTLFEVTRIPSEQQCFVVEECKTRQHKFVKFPAVRNKLAKLLDTPTKALTQQDINFAATIASGDELIGRTNQLHNYDWFTSAHSSYVISCLEDYFPAAQGEVFFEVYRQACSPSGHPIMGCFDILSNHRLVEVKYVSQLQPTHHLQLIIYAWLYGQTEGSEAAARLSYDLLNVRTRECWSCTYDHDRFADIVQRVVDYRNAAACKSDAQFIYNCFNAPGVLRL